MAKKHQSFQSLVYSTNPAALSREEEAPMETPEPSRQNLKVKLDKKQRKGKIVTLVTGFEGRNEDLVALAKQLKNKCGSGGSAKEGQILIQGDFREKVTQLLGQWGYKTVTA